MDNRANQNRIYDEELTSIQNDDLHKLCHRSIGAIKFTTRDKKMGIGSAFLISNNLVITAAHNLYDREQGYQYDEVRFYLQTDGVGSKYYQAESWKYLDQFKTCQSLLRLQFDYALIKLNGFVDHKEFVSISKPCQKCLIMKNKQIELSIFGYPYHKQNFKPLDKYGNKIKLHQYGLTKSNRIVFIQPINFKIAYGISTYGGQSGCPVISSNKVIALHNGAGLQNEQFNVGRFITSDFINHLQVWSQELKGNKFIIKIQDQCNHVQKKLQENQQIHQKQQQKEIS